MRLTTRDRLVLFAPLAMLLVAFFAGPALVGLAATFTDYSPFTTEVRLAGLANYGEVLRDPQFVAAAGNAAVFTALAVPLELAVGFALASLLRRPLRGRAAWRVLLLVPWLVSPIASGVMWHFLLGATNGIVDFALGWLGAPQGPSPAGDVRTALFAVVAIEVWRVAPFVAFLLLPGLESIPQERWDQARLAGASVAQQLLRVGLPGLRGSLLTVGMLLTGLALGTFDTILILTGGGPGTATLTPALYSYHAAFAANNWPAGAAAAWIVAGAVFAVGAVYLWTSRRLVVE